MLYYGKKSPAGRVPYTPDATSSPSYLLLIPKLIAEESGGT